MDDTKSNNKGRKRKTDDQYDTLPCKYGCPMPPETNLTPEEQEKKRKNRDAAKKCRDKKEKEAQLLKERNSELESENATLSKEKISLQQRIQEFKNIIHSHMQKGCKLPPEIEMALQQDDPLDDEHNDDCSEKGFRKVGVIETPTRMHTPPHTPDSSSSSNLSPPLYQGPITVPSAVSLFSGDPINDEIIKRKNSSCSRSPSASPGPPSYSNRGKVIDSKDLSHHLQSSKTLPAALSPIQAKLPRNNTQLSDVNKKYLSSLVPTVVIDDDEEDEVQMSSKGSSTPFDRSEKLKWVPIADKPVSATIINKAFEHPDVPSNDIISNQLFKNRSFKLITNNSQSSENFIQGAQVNFSSEPDNLNKPDSRTIINKAFEHPDVPSEDIISNQLFKNPGIKLITNKSQSSEHFTQEAQLFFSSEPDNLNSLGFNQPTVTEGYSYTEDLAEVDSLEKTAYQVEQEQYVSDSVHTAENNQLRISFSNASDTHELPLEVLSTAILGLGSNVSNTLQEQIKKQFSTLEENETSAFKDHYTIMLDQGNTQEITGHPGNAVSSLNNETIPSGSCQVITVLQGLPESQLIYQFGSKMYLRNGQQLIELSEKQFSNSISIMK